MENLGPYPLNSIITGDAKILAREIPDESVDLIFTDPVYQNIKDYEWLGKVALRILKTHGSILAFCGHPYTIPAGAAMLGELIAGPILEHYIGGSMGRLFSHSVQCNVLPCLWFSKGLPKNDWMAIQALSVSRELRGHKWGKAEAMAYYRISRLTNIYDIIWDPFCGGGTIPAVCKKLGRNYLAFEINPETAELARQRVAQTQPPLFVLEPQQLELSV